MPTINYSYLPQFEPGTYHPIFDPTGQLPANLVTSEIHTITSVNSPDHHFIVPLFAPFFANGLQLTYEPAGGSPVALVEGQDYQLAFEFIGASRGTARPVYGGIVFLNNDLAGNIRLNQYRTIGGNWCLNLPEITEILANRAANPRVVAWEQVTNYPNLFPVIDHEWNLDDMVGMSEVVTALNDIAQAIADRPAPVLPLDLADHLNDFSNPHQVTKSDVGLGLANNYATASTAEAVAGVATNLHVTPAGVKAAVDAGAVNLQLELAAHIDDTNNPHNTTKVQVGLGNVENYPIATTPEAEAATANDRYMTPLRTMDLLTAKLLTGMNANFGTLTAATASVTGVLTVGTRILVGTGGLIFNEIGQDSGINSPGDGIVDMMANGVMYVRAHGPNNRVEMGRTVLGAQTSLAMVAGEGTTNGSFWARSTGTGDSNLAGMAFNATGYAIKLGVRNDGVFGLGGWSRAAWSWYSDSSGNMVAAGNVIAYSDPRLKEKIRPITGASAKLRKLTGAYFVWRKGIEHTSVKAGQEDIGVMADQVKLIFPEIVYKSISLAGIEYDMVAYDKLVAPLIVGHNEHSDAIEALQKENQELREALRKQTFAAFKTRERVAMLERKMAQLLGE